MSLNYLLLSLSGKVHELKSLGTINGALLYEVRMGKGRL